MKVVTPSGEGMIMNISRREQTVTVEISAGHRVTVNWDEIVESTRVEKNDGDPAAGLPARRRDHHLAGRERVLLYHGCGILAAFPHLVKKAKVLELGCGTGAVSLLLSNRGAAQVLGVDINPHVVELLQKSIRDNHREDRVEARVLDLRDYKQLPCDTMDLVAANPPYRIGGR